MQPKPSIKKCLKTIHAPELTYASLKIIFSELPQCSIKTWLASWTCLQARLEMKLDNIFVSSTSLQTDSLLTSLMTTRKDSQNRVVPIYIHQKTTRVVTKSERSTPLTTGIFCDGTRRYSVPAPFFKRRNTFFKYTLSTNKLFAYRHLFSSVNKKLFYCILVRNATENLELNTKCFRNSG